MEYYPNIREQPIRGELERVSQAINYITQSRVEGTTLGYTEITSNFTTTTVGSDVDVTNLTTTVNVPYGGRRIKITAFAPGFQSSEISGNLLRMSIKEGSTELGANDLTATSGYATPAVVMYSGVPTAGSHTYKVTVQQGAAGTITVIAAATRPAFILVELI